MTDAIAAPGTKPSRDPALPAVASHRILGLRVDVTSYDETADAALELAAAGRSGMVCVASVHVVMEAFDDPELQRAMNACDRVTPDGVPLVWTLRWRGSRGAGRVYGPSLTPALCRRAEAEGVPVGFLGGRPEVLEKLRARLLERFPRLRIAFCHSPPFRPLSDAEDEALSDAIEASGARILFVGLGCPKQERWMARHRERLGCVMVTVGAAFDFLAGTTSQAPGFMQRAGLEWLYRLAIEPRRLWRRYLFNNPRFVVHLLREQLRARRA